jgi:hypothetical protein
MLDPSLQEHYKTKMIQQEQHKTEYHICEVMAGIIIIIIIIIIIKVFYYLESQQMCNFTNVKFLFVTVKKIGPS